MNIFLRLIEPKIEIREEQKLFSNKDLKEMMVPLFLEQLLLLVVGLADTMMVSYAGESAVSGVSLDTMIYTIFTMLFTALSTGGCIIVAQYIGHKEIDKASRSASQLFLISAIFSLVCMVLMLAFGNTLLSLLYPKVEADVMQACKTYLFIVTLSFPANAIYNAGTALYRAMGKTSTTMKVSMAMNLVNIVGNAIGVFVLHLEAAGVAWPTTISWYFACVVMTILCFQRNNIVSIYLKHIFTFDKDIIQRILKVAIPNAIENGLFQVAKVLLGSLTSTFGTQQIAANGIGQTIWSLSACSLTSMSNAFVTCVGQCKGKGDDVATRYYLLKLTRITALMSFIWNAFILCMMPLLVQLYDISDYTKELLYTIVIIHNIFSGTVGVFFSPFSSGLRAAGDIKFTMIVSIFCTVIVRTSLSFLFAYNFGLGVIGIALAMVSDWTLKSILVIARYHSGKWLNYKLI